MLGIDNLPQHKTCSYAGKSGGSVQRNSLFEGRCNNFLCNACRLIAERTNISSKTCIPNFPQACYILIQCIEFCHIDSMPGNSGIFSTILRNVSACNKLVIGICHSSSRIFELPICLPNGIAIYYVCIPNCNFFH